MRYQDNCDLCKEPYFLDELVLTDEGLFVCYTCMYGSKEQDPPLSKAS